MKIAHQENVQDGKCFLYVFEGLMKIDVGYFLVSASKYQTLTILYIIDFMDG